MPGRSLSASSLYRYGFNGKEKDADEEWGSTAHYDYGFRIYNPTIGRFLSVDPLTKDYPWYTPYQFAGNKPIIAVDLDGLEERVVIKYNSSEKETTQIINLTDKGGEAQIRSIHAAFHKAGSFSGETHFWLAGYDKYSKKYPIFKGTLTIDQTGEVPVLSYDPNRVVREPSELERKLSNIGQGFVEAGEINKNFFVGQNQDARVARKMVGGIVGLALAIPTGGGSLEVLGVLEMSLASNDIASSINDATSSDGNVDSNVLRDMLANQFGEEAGLAFDAYSVGVSTTSVITDVGKGFDRFIEFKDGAAVESFLRVIKGTNDFKNNSEKAIGNGIKYNKGNE